MTLAAATSPSSQQRHVWAGNNDDVKGRWADVPLRREKGPKGGRATGGGTAAASGARVLCLHAFGSTGDDFRKRAAPLRRLLRDAIDEEAGWCFLDGPAELPDGGRAWWTLHDQLTDGSFFTQTAEYDGVDVFYDAVREVERHRGPFALIVGFSQGTSAPGLLPSLRGCVLMSGFPPRDPRTALPLTGLRVPSLHVMSADDTTVPRVRGV
eukprot:gene37760-10266_t